MTNTIYPYRPGSTPVPDSPKEQELHFTFDETSATSEGRTSKSPASPFTFSHLSPISPPPSLQSRRITPIPEEGDHSAQRPHHPPFKSLPTLSKLAAKHFNHPPCPCPAARMASSAWKAFSRGAPVDPNLLLQL